MKRRNVSHRGRVCGPARCARRRPERPEQKAIAQAGGGIQAPRFEVDPMWPQAAPERLVHRADDRRLGGHQDHVWIIHRNDSPDAVEAAADQNPPTGACCKKAPPIVEFDAAGKVVNAWGGPGQGYDWPDSNHGIYADTEGFRLDRRQRRHRRPRAEVHA